MNDQQLDDLFDQDIPKPNENAKRSAINNAMSEFSQGFEPSARLITNRENWFSKTIKSFGSYLMTPQKKSYSNGAFASIAVVFVAASVYFLLPNLQKENSTVSVSSVDNLPPQTLEETSIAVSPVSSNRDSDAIELSTKQAIKPKPAQEAVVSHSQTNTPKSIDTKHVKTQVVDSLSVNEIVSIPTKPIETTLTSLADKPQLKLSSEKQTLSTIKSRRVVNVKRAESNSIISLAPPIPQPILIGESANYSLPRLDDNEQYPEYKNNSIKRVNEEPVSTFSIDVDTASYSLVRNQLNNGFLPKPNAVRAEELINYFDYNYPLPTSKKRPFKPTISVLDSPWNEHKKLVHIGIKGYEIQSDNTPDSNIVFLLDVSGSMNSEKKLPLVKQSLNLLLDTLKPTDTVSMVVYAGAAGVVLEPTKVKNKSVILEAVKNLRAGGSTAGGQGIELAYQLAEQNFDKDAVNRIFLATDGDFNVGMKSNDELKHLVERKRDKGIFLSVLGFGRSNYQDDMMQTLAQNGNGVAAYIDTLSEAKKVLVDEATSTLFTIAKDVKIQIEFNPATVSEYRLIGYETRALKREDFNNDKVDAGDIGAGHTVTAIYEITPAGAENQSIDKPRYQANTKSITSKAKADDSEYGFIKIRYKSPTGSKSKLIEQAISVKQSHHQTSSEVLFSTAVAGFAQLLTKSSYTGDLTYSDLIKLAKTNKGDDEFGYRSEFIQLIRMAEIAKP